VTRDWKLARAKVEAEGVCRNCRRRRVKLDAAHVIGREHDRKPAVRALAPFVASLPPVVHPDRIIPLCHDCHQGPDGQHAGRLDVLRLLVLDEQVQAVADANGILLAMRRLIPDREVRLR
jgi:hypothetical protein